MGGSPVIIIKQGTSKKQEEETVHSRPFASGHAQTLTCFVGERGQDNKAAGLLSMLGPSGAVPDHFQKACYWPEMGRVPRARVCGKPVVAFRPFSRILYHSLSLSGSPGRA